MQMPRQLDCLSLMHCRLHSFMKKDLFTDITIVIGNSKLRAHKAILASSSTVFQTMFESSLEEAVSNQVTITDVDFEVFKDFLDYIYIRDEKYVTKHPNEMLMLADKYDIEPLAILCDEVLVRNLTAENAADTLLTADLYRRGGLKESVISFIKKKLGALSSNSWAKLENDVEILKAIVHSVAQIEDDSAVISRSINEVTWTIKYEDVWYEMREVTPWVELAFDDRPNPNVIFKASLTSLNSCLAVHIKVKNKLNEMVDATFHVSRSYGGKLTGQVTFNSPTIYPNSHDELKIYIPANALYCEYSYPVIINLGVKRTYPTNLNPYTKTLTKWDQRFSDAALVVKNMRFPVHKLILAMQSEYLSELFHRYYMKEYIIDDMPVSTLRALVEYMYSGLNPPPEELDLSLLRGAKKFKLDDLAECCEINLLKTIGPKNAVKRCVVARELGLDNLATVAMDFMAKNSVRIASSKDIDEYPSLLKEILLKLSR